MLDIHSHILPGIDDGSRTIEESIAVLQELKKQGCTHVVATPHFYAQTTDIADFKVIFNQKFSELSEAIKGMDLPEILPGCEVFFFNAIATCADLDELTLNGSEYLLLELPDKLTAKVLDAIIDLNLNRGYTPIIAHIERYSRSPFYGNLLELVSKGYALSHLNTTSFLCTRTRRDCYALIKHNLITYIASDVHGIKRRPVSFNKAFSKIERKFGTDVKQAFIDNSIALLNDIRK